MKLNKKVEVQNGRLQVVAEAVEQINHQSTKKLQQKPTKAKKTKCTTAKCKQSDNEEGDKQMEDKKESNYCYIKAKTKKKTTQTLKKMGDIKAEKNKVHIIEDDDEKISTYIKRKNNADKNDVVLIKKIRKEKPQI